MKEWNRTTREITLEKINPAIYVAIQQHLDEFKLGPILDDYKICIETVSEKIKKGLFSGGKKETVVSIDILTPAWLIDAVMDEKGNVAALSVKRNEMHAEDYTHTPGYNIIQDNGVNVTGTFTGRVGMDGNQRISKFIGLGEESAAKYFKTLLLS